MKVISQYKMHNYVTARPTPNSTTTQLKVGLETTTTNSNYMNPKQMLLVYISKTEKILEPHPNPQKSPIDP